MTEALGLAKFDLVPLKRLFRVVNGGTPPADGRFWGGDVTWVTPGDLALRNGTVITTSARTLTTDGLACGSALVPEGSLILSTRAPIGYVVRAGSELSTNQGCKSLVPRVGMEPQFFQFVLGAARPALQACGNGSTFMELSTVALGSILVPVPSVANQRSIADHLDAETARIDELIAEQELQLRLIMEHRHALLSRAVGARLGRETSSLEGALEPLQEGWRLVPLKTVAAIQSGLTLGKTYDGPLQERPYLRVANVQDGGMILEEITTIEVPPDVAARCELRVGDVLMTEGGDNDKLGRGTIWRGEIPNCLHQNHVFAVRPDPAVLHPEYLAVLTASAWGRAYFMATAHQTTNLAATNRAKVGRFPVPLPPLARQDHILSEVGEQLAGLDIIQAEARHQVAFLRERRQAIITTAVTQGIDGLPGVA